MDQTGMTMATYSTEEIIAEIRRREGATPAQRTRETLGSYWEMVGVLATRAELPRWQCEIALDRLVMDGEAEWTVKAGVIFWRRTKLVAFTDMAV